MFAKTPQHGYPQEWDTSCVKRGHGLEGSGWLHASCTCSGGVECLSKRAGRRFNPGTKSSPPPIEARGFVRRQLAPATAECGAAVGTAGRDGPCERRICGFVTLSPPCTAGCET
ncbi:unnamed protein product [Lampetra fluviatilis]